MDQPSGTAPAPSPSTPPGKRDIRELSKELWAALEKWFGELMDLRTGLDREGTIIAIKSGKRMEGANAWMLMCSIMIASLGLDLNSPAVIIGAMLISPLMSPILGIGLAVAINDREALFISLRHFGIAILIALITSVLYFSITPLGQLTSEIQARTKPTFLDGLVAIFGGLAGIISTTRKDKSNAIPGVAIATALMPPLCVTGYGIVYGITEGKWNVMFNSFYLFFLNSFFIALTTYLIIRLLKFPLRAHVDERDATRTRWIITFFSLVLIIPSTIILYNLYLEQRDKLKVEAFIRDHFEEDPQTKCIGYSIIADDTSKQVILQLLGKPIPQDSMEVYSSEFESYGLENTRLSFIQNADINLDQINKMQLQLSNLGQIAQKLESVTQAKTAQEKELDRYRHILDSLRADTLPFQDIGLKARVFIKGLDEIAYGRVQETDFKSPPGSLPLFLVRWDRSKNRIERQQDEQKLYDFLKLETRFDTLKIVAY